MRCSEIRDRFVRYYQSQGFQHLHRAPMMHPSIPMSFVMSAGLVQVETSLANAKHRSGNQFVLVQECFRHFDLQTIGTDNIHLSLFEMPAAFIFGNNDRTTAITHIWTVVTEVLGVDPERLWVSYFGGDLVEGYDVPADTATYETWRSLGVPEHRLVGLGRKDNYWVQGGGIDNEYASELRKCGPNTELFYDTGEEFACGPTCRPGCRCGRFIEFSNTLFVAFHVEPHADTLVPMQDPFTEIVIGSERIAMILQNSPSVFDTHEYHSVLKIIRRFTRAADVSPRHIQESERVIADHLRALCVLVADGAPPPGKDGRQRIVKLLIRAIISRQVLLGIDSAAFFTRLLSEMEKTFMREMNGTRALFEQTILTYINDERSKFLKTIERGKKQLEKFLAANRGNTLSGEQILFLEKRYGLPYLLTSIELRRKGFPVLQEEYLHAFSEWKHSFQNN